ncbi:MAG: ABC transporter permease subunit [Bacteroidota bacterium]
MIKKVKSDQFLSPNQRAWRRLWKNKPAIFGMLLIGLAVLVAIFAYWIAPDASPNANEQIPAIALKSPGFEVQLLTLRKNRQVEQTNGFQRLAFGQPNTHKFIPINSYVFVEDSIRVERYRGEDLETGKRIPGKTIAFHLADVVFPLAINQQIEYLNDQLRFVDLDGQIQEHDRSALQQKIETAHLQQRTFYLGTDRFGRSMLSRLIIGVRISLLVGCIAVFISLTIGILLGAAAGYIGGRVDDFILLLINTVWSIPTLLLVFAIVLALGRGIGIIFLAVGLTMWVDVARIVRGQVMAFRSIQFVEAAQSMGFGTWRIMIRHILPNILGPVMVIAAANFATAILIEAGLSYLGFGIQPPTPSWGTMLNENYGYAIGGKPFLALVPAVAIMLMVLAFNLVGNGFRDALDIKVKT